MRETLQRFFCESGQGRRRTRAGGGDSPEAGQDYVQARRI